MDNILDRIAAATRELNQVQTELYSRALAPDPSTAHSFLDEPRSLAVLANFKAAMDELRRFLWLYVDAVAKRTGQDADALIETSRIHRAAELLRDLRADFRSRPDSAPECAQTFMEQITQVVESYVQEPPAPGAESNGDSLPAASHP